MQNSITRSGSATNQVSRMMTVFLVLISFSSGGLLYSQVILNANGEGETYELINSVLAPDGNVIETPDCAHPEFGRHIDEIYDSIQEKYVFRFHIHVTPDNDRCIKFDRQRNEIKTYASSPSNLKATEGETVLYEFRFRIDSGFQSSPSFTHLHQLKAVGGSEASMPLITLTTRKGSPDKLELRYAKTTSQTTLKKVSLDPFKGKWVQVSELVEYGESGSYDLVITTLEDSTVLFEYSNDNIRMWKTSASFIRPKWGIYRSLNYPDDLRDEMVLFSDYLIEELATSTNEIDGPGNLISSIYPNPAGEYLHVEINGLSLPYNIIIYDVSGRMIRSMDRYQDQRIDISSLDKGVYLMKIQFENQKSEVHRFIKH